MTTERDSLLDSLRALIMMYIVCVIHIIYWFGLFDEPLRSIILFEMPVIFFIAGASQSLKTTKGKGSLGKELVDTFVNRTKRVILPFYAFLAILYVFMAVCTWWFDGAMGFDLTKLSATDFIKTLLTGGCEKINFYGYTWFISCYFIVSLLLPVYKRTMTVIGKYPFFALNMMVIILLSFVDLPIGNRELKNIPLYSLFYMGGYVFYRRIKGKLFVGIAAVSTVATIIFFLLDMVTPMQNHKFPADYIFMFFGISAISLLSLVFSTIKIPNHHIIGLWNTEGYHIYLYQTITFSIAVCICNTITTLLHSQIALYMVYAVTVFLMSTLLAFISKRIHTLEKTIKITKK